MLLIGYDTTAVTRIGTSTRYQLQLYVVGIFGPSDPVITISSAVYTGPDINPSAEVLSRTRCYSINNKSTFFDVLSVKCTYTTNYSQIKIYFLARTSYGRTVNTYITIDDSSLLWTAERVVRLDISSTSLIEGCPSIYIANFTALDYTDTITWFQTVYLYSLSPSSNPVSITKHYGLPDGSNSDVLYWYIVKNTAGTLSSTYQIPYYTTSQITTTISTGKGNRAVRIIKDTNNPDVIELYTNVLMRPTSTGLGWEYQYGAAFYPSLEALLDSKLFRAPAVYTENVSYQLSSGNITSWTYIPAVYYNYHSGTQVDTLARYFLDAYYLDLVANNGAYFEHEWWIYDTKSAEMQYETQVFRHPVVWLHPSFEADLKFDTLCNLDFKFLPDETLMDVNLFIDVIRVVWLFLFDPAFSMSLSMNDDCVVVTRGIQPEDTSISIDYAPMEHLNVRANGTTNFDVAIDLLVKRLRMYRECHPGIRVEYMWWYKQNRRGGYIAIPEDICI